MHKSQNEAHTHNVLNARNAGAFLSTLSFGAVYQPRRPIASHLSAPSKGSALAFNTWRKGPQLSHWIFHPVQCNQEVQRLRHPTLLINLCGLSWSGRHTSAVKICAAKLIKPVKRTWSWLVAKLTPKETSSFDEVTTLSRVICLGVKINKTHGFVNQLSDRQVRQDGWCVKLRVLCAF